MPKNPSHNSWTRNVSMFEEAMVLILNDSKEPLSLAEISSIIVDRKLVTIRGKTPQNSLYSIVTRNEKRRTDRGQPTLFKKHYKGVNVRYSLNTKGNKFATSTRNS
jgi:hypothetical protein